MNNFFRYKKYIPILSYYIISTLVCVVYSLSAFAQDEFWGITQAGGEFRNGTIFSIDSTGKDFTIQHNFSDIYSTLHVSSSTLLQLDDGYFYGMTRAGGTHNGGLIFKIGIDGAQYSVIKEFNCNTDGCGPYGKLIQGKDGALYGLNYGGGQFKGGTVFKINPDGSNFKVLRHLRDEDGVNPMGSLIQGSDGYFYGVTDLGGLRFWGTIFKISSNGSSFKVIKNFAGDIDGAQPNGTLLQAYDGYLYGTTTYGGMYDKGLIFKISTNGDGYSRIYSFFDLEGMNPQRSALIEASRGVLYGTAYRGGLENEGSVFKINTNGSGLRILKHFRGPDGAFPIGGLVKGTDGSLYGFTSAGGEHNKGTIFKIYYSSLLNILTFKTLRHFNTWDGASPSGELTLLKLYAKPLTVTINEDTLLPITLTGVGTSNLTYKIISNPQHGTLGGTLPNLTYTPSPDYTGTDQFTFNVSDGRRESNTATVKIDVVPVNDAPVIDLISDKLINEGSNLTFTVTATDKDSAPATLSFSLMGDIPVGATINQQTGVFTWKPSEVQGPADYTLIVRVSDGELTSDREVLIKVKEVNANPSISALEPINGNLFSQIKFIVDVQDSDLPANKFTFSLISAPLGATIHSQTGEFSWTPDKAQDVGKYKIIIKVMDEGLIPLSDEETVTVTIGKGIQSIDFTEIPDKYSNDEAFDLIATSSSGLPVTFTLISGPAELSGNKVTLTGEAGEVIIQASQVGNELYMEAPQMQRTFQVNAVLAVDDVLTQAVKIYPNPNIGVFTVELPNALQNSLLKVLTIHGSTIIEHAINKEAKLDLSLTHLAKGIYLIYIYNHKGTVIKRLHIK